MRLEIQHGDTVVVIDNQQDGDGHYGELTNLFRAASLALGFHPNTVDSYITAYEDF